MSNMLHLTPVSGRVDLVKHYFPQVTGFMLIDSALSGQKGAFTDALRHLILPHHRSRHHSARRHRADDRSSMLEVLEGGLCAHRARQGPADGPGRRRACASQRAHPGRTVIGLSVGTLLAGAVLTETIFSWPGVGKWLIESIGGGATIQRSKAASLLISSIVIVVNLIVDLLYGLINPRIRHGR